MCFGVASGIDAVNYLGSSSSLKSGTVPVRGESRSVDLPRIGVIPKGLDTPWQPSPQPRARPPHTREV